ncbi:hypothetical protein Tco_0483327 [Tanacetum coccineum]
MNTRLNIKKLDGNIVQKHGGSKQVGFKQLGPGVKTGVHGVHDEKRVWFEEDKAPERDNTDRLVKEQEKEITDWGGKIKSGNVLDSCNQSSTQQCMKSRVAKHLGVAGLKQQNGSPSSAIGFKKPIDMLGFFGWLASIEQGMLEPVKVKCIFLGYREGIVGNKLWRLDDVTSKVRVQCSYREDSNEAAFVVATVDKIYAHELLTFNNIVSCEVIFKWEAGLKDDMDARSDVYVLSNGCKICSDDSDGYYWEYTPVGSQEYQVVCTRPDIATANVDMLDGFDRGLQTNVQVFMDFNYIMGRSITVMSRSITGYGLLILGCVGSLKANLQHMEALSITKVRYMMFTKARKKEIWLKGLFIESRYKLRLVAGIATGALVKGCSRSKVLAHVKVAVYRY